MPSLSRALANHPINIPPEFPAILKAYTKVIIMVMVMVTTSPSIYHQSSPPHSRLTPR